MSTDDDDARDRKKTRHIDQPLGEALRLERDARGLSRDWVAERLGVSISTIQKYEEGRTRVPAARLWQVCNLLGVDVAALFSDLPHHVLRDSAQTGVVATGVAETGAAFARDDGRARRASSIARHAARLTDERLEIAETLVKALRTGPAA